MPAFYSVVEVAAVIGLLVSLVLVVRAWRVLPSEIPIHFGFSGEPDGWGPRGCIVIVPAGALLMWAGLTIPGRFFGTAGDPTMWMLVVCKAEVVWLFTYMTWKTVQVALKKAVGLGRWFLPMSLVLVAATMIAYFVCAIFNIQ